MHFKSLDWNDALDRFFSGPFPGVGTWKRMDFATNVLIFIPLGFCCLGAVDLDRHRRIAGFIAAPLLAAALIGFSVTIEFFQQWTVRRNPSHYDVLAQVIGGIIGLLLWLLAGRSIMAKMREVIAPPAPVATAQEQAKAMTQRLRRFLLFYATGFVLYNLQPLDIAFSPAAIEQKAAQGRISLVPFALMRNDIFNALWQIGSDMLLFLPLGMLFRLTNGPPRSLLKATLFAFLAALAVELAQLFVFTRYVDSTDLITGTLGGFIGALLAGRLVAMNAVSLNVDQASASNRREAIAVLLGVVYSVPLLIFSWQPFTWVDSRAQFQANLQAAINLPFSGHFVGSEFNALTKSLRDLMYFVPFGLLCRWAWNRTESDRRTGRCIVSLIGLLLGALIEVGQAATKTRFADITSVMLTLTGAWLGWWAWGLIVRKPPLCGMDGSA